MYSSWPKVLHTIAGQSLPAPTLAAVREAGGTTTAVVVGPAADGVIAEAKRVLPAAEFFVQAERRGTAHAVLAARGAIARGPQDVLVVFADTPLVTSKTLRRMRAALAEGAALVVLGFRPTDPRGYGRIVLAGAGGLAIREGLDAGSEEAKADLCNAGLMALSGATALSVLDRVGNDNRKGEFYLTDAVAIVHAMGGRAVVIEAGEEGGQ